MHIETIETIVSLPVALQEPAETVAVPPEVEVQAKQGKLWHLLAWKDIEGGTCGFYRNKIGVVLPLGNIQAAIINVMKPAKGKGYVALDVWLQNGDRAVSVFEAGVYNPDAFLWFLSQKSKFEEILGQPIEVRDLGSDY
jgi:hypothetical protein